VLRALARRSLPRTGGELRLPTLDAPVEVIRDVHGVPHIYARGRRDLARAMGFVHAQDRLAQMEGLRRFAFGRLAELVGPRALELDRTARRLRLRWAAEQDIAAADPETTAIAEAYCEGVNAFIATGPRPFELRLARIRPEPWTLVDVHAPAQVFAASLSGNWEVELARSRLPAELLAWLPSYPEGHPVQGPAVTVPGLRGGSNAVVVSGARTASGHPLLANDPHLLLGLPSIWHAMHLVWDGGECVGVTTPGAPVVILGRTRRVAWGMTTAMVDTQDLFAERIRPGDPPEYEVDGEWRPAEVVREEIAVRGAEAVVEDVLVTRHGPVVAHDDEGGALALAWTHHRPGETLRSLLDLMQASTLDDADRALDRFAGPPHSFLLADEDGAIEYRLAGGPVPVRSRGDGSLPLVGWDSGNDWRGVLGPEELPRVRDPDEGIIASANNRVANLPGEYLSGYRAARLPALLGPHRDLRPADLEAAMLDLRSDPGLALAAATHGLEAPDELGSRALELLRAWDGELGPESEGGAVYGALVGALSREVWAAKAPGLAPPPGYGERGRPGLIRALAERDDDVFPGAETWEGVFARALDAAVASLGPDPSRWRRGEMHRLHLRHPLDRRGLRRLVSRGPFPRGGDVDTVSLLTEAPHGAMIGASMRAVYDLGDPDGTRIALCGGQSGHPASGHYADLLPLWLRGDYVDLPMSRGRVEALAESRLVLSPE